jgi:hypothetical protein
MEDIINKDLESIFDFIYTGHRREGCSHKDIKKYFEHFITIAYKYVIYNYKILNFIKNIKKKLSSNFFDCSFFILETYKFYENKLKNLIMANVNKLNEFVVEHLRRISIN